MGIAAAAVKTVLQLGVFFIILRDSEIIDLPLKFNLKILIFSYILFNVITKNKDFKMIYFFMFKT